MSTMLRSLQLTSTPASPVTLVEAKLAARIDTSDMDGWIQDLLTAAIEHAQHDTNRTLCTATFALKIPSPIMAMEDLGRPPLQTLPAWPLYVASWPLAPYLELPMPPLVSVQSVTYYDPNENVVTMNPATYTVDPAPRRGRICLLPNIIWPIVARRWDAMTVNFTAGYGAASAVPAGIKIGIKKLVNYWFHHPSADDVPPNIQSIFNRYAVYHRGY